MEHTAIQPDSPWNCLLPFGTVVNVRRGHLLVRPGQRASSIPFVIQGTVRVYELCAHGRELTLYRTRGGDACCLAMLSALSGDPFDACAVAESDVSFLSVSPDTLQRLLKQHEELAAILFRSLQHRVHGLVSLLSQLAFERLDRRLASFLLSRMCGQPQMPELEITHEEIAAELGTAREAVSRILKAFERAGGLRLERGRVQLTANSLAYLESKVGK